MPRAQFPAKHCTDVYKRQAIKKGSIVGAICNAASFLAKHGFLNEIKHTGNGLEQLQLWGDVYKIQALMDGRKVGIR